MKKRKEPKIPKPCGKHCGEMAVVQGMCRSCYMKERNKRDGEKRVRLWTTCLVCGASVLVWPGQRYCREHERLREEEAAHIEFVFHEDVHFSDPDPDVLLDWAVKSIRILGPDGSLDEERTKCERGQWLTRMLQGPWTKESEL